MQYSSELQTRPLPCATTPVEGPIVLAAEREPVVFIPGAYGEMVPVTRHQAELLLSAVHAQATAPRDLTPQPLLDSRAQLLLAGGIGGGALAAGTGWGLAQALSSLAGVGGGTVVWLLCLLAAGRALGTRTSTTTNTYVTHNTARWWGRTTTRNH